MAFLIERKSRASVYLRTEMEPGSQKQGMETPGIHCRWRSLERCLASEGVVNERRQAVPMQPGKMANFAQAAPRGSSCYSCVCCLENLDLRVTKYKPKGYRVVLSGSCWGAEPSSHQNDLIYLNCFMSMSRLGPKFLI